jgi:tetratricopeptide (TPR) repeat protein
VKSTKNLEAWGYYVESIKYLHRFTKEEVAKARELCEQALRIDPEYINALIALTWTHLRDARFGFGDSRTKSLKIAAKLGQRALDLDNSNSACFAAHSQINLLQRRFDKALEYGEKSISLGPNYADIHAFYAQVKFSVGMWEDCIALINKAMRLHPLYPPWYLYFLGVSYARVGRFDEAIATLKDCINREPDSWAGYVGLAVLYVKLGKEKKARNFIDKIRQLNIEISLEQVRQIAIYKDPALLEDVVDALRMAGLK